MRYLPTIDLWNHAFHNALLTGQIKLLPGQWVKCGSEKKSRFVCLTPGARSIWAAHWQGNGKASLERFKALHNAAKASGYLKTKA